MSPSLPSISGKDAIRALERAGFSQVSQKGSHVKLRDNHGRTIIRQAGLTPEAFRQFL